MVDPNHVAKALLDKYKPLQGRFRVILCPELTAMAWRYYRGF